MTLSYAIQGRIHGETTAQLPAVGANAATLDAAAIDYGGDTIYVSVKIASRACWAANGAAAVALFAGSGADVDEVPVASNVPFPTAGKSGKKLFVMSTAGLHATGLSYKRESYP